MSLLPTLPYAQTITALNTPLNPLLGGSLGIGPTGLSGLAGQLPGVGPLPFRGPAGPTGLFGGSAGPAGLPRLGATGAQQLADVATLRPLASSTAPMAAETGLASQMGRAVSGSGARGLLASLPIKNPGLVKGGLWGLGGSLGASAVDRLNIGGGNSIADQFLTGAAFGGIAAVPFGGPVASAVAAPIAGALNVLGNQLGIFGGGEDEAPDPLNVLSTAITQADLSPDATENILSTYETLMALAEQQPEGEMRDAARQQAFDQTAQLVLQQMQQEQAASQLGTAMGGPGLLAMQQQAQQIFEPIAQDIEANASLYAQAVAGLRDQLPESYRAVVDTNVARELTSADKLANAYRAQAALTPVAQQLTQYQQQADAFARQQYQQTLAQQAAGGMAGGGGASDILTQLAG